MALQKKQPQQPKQPTQRSQPPAQPQPREQHPVKPNGFTPPEYGEPEEEYSWDEYNIRRKSEDEEYEEDDEYASPPVETRRPAPRPPRRPTPKQQPKPRANKTTQTRRRTSHHVSLPWNECFLEGTVFRPNFSMIATGTYIWTCGLSVYNGKDSNGNYRPSMWFNITMWGDLAQKADEWLVERVKVKFYGKLTQRTYDGKSYVGVEADHFELL